MLYVLIPVFIWMYMHFLYKCIYLYLHPRASPNSHMYVHGHEYTHTHKCTQNCFVTVTFWNNIPKTFFLAYFVIRFLRLLIWCLFFFLVTLPSSSHNINCVLCVCAWHSPIALHTCLSKCPPGTLRLSERTTLPFSLWETWETESSCLQ